MLRTYSNNITTNANTGIVFDTNKILSNNNLLHTEGSANIDVAKSGYYEINFNISYTIPSTTTVASDTDTQATTSTPIIIQLYADNEPIVDTTIQSTVTAEKYVSNSFNTIIKATPGMIGNNVRLSIKPDTTIDIADVSLGIMRVSNI